MEQKRIPVNNVSAVALIMQDCWEPGDRVERIFCSVKDDGHPLKLVRRQLCPIGGNWIGANATADTSPLYTCRRELWEELTLTRGRRCGIELEQLGLSQREVFDPTPIKGEPIEEDRRSLAELVVRICNALQLNGTWIHSVSTEAIRAADPDSPKTGFRTLSYCFTAQLDRQDWKELLRLQEQYSNLSNEAPTLVVGLDEALKFRRPFAFAHGAAVAYATGTPMLYVDGTWSERVFNPPTDYEGILQRFEVAARPTGR